MTLKGLGIRKWVSSELVSYVFTIQRISIIFCNELFMCYHWIKLGNLLMYLTLSMIRCISAELLYASQTAAVWIGKWLPDWATTNNTASHFDLTKIGSSFEI